MSVSYKMRGMDKWMRDLEGKTQKTQDSVAKELNRSALRVEGRATEYAPWDTGLLSMSIYSWQKKKLIYEVVSPVHYSIYNELGTRFRPPLPFLYPAVEEEFPILMGRLEKIVKG